MMALGLVPMLDHGRGRVSEAVLEAIAGTLEDFYPVQVERLEALESPPSAYEPERRQHSAPLVLQMVLGAIPSGPAKLLAVTGGDLFIPMLSFVFGQAQLGGRAAVISVARLDPAFYGFDPDEALLVRRARTVALHETGHLFGLVHCQTQDCAMRLSTSIQQFDRKRAALCAGCASILLETQR